MTTRERPKVRPGIMARIGLGSLLAGLLLAIAILAMIWITVASNNTVTEIARDRALLAHAEAILLVVHALESDAALPDKVASPKAATEVRNPFS